MPIKLIVGLSQYAWTDQLCMTKIWIHFQQRQFSSNWANAGLISVYKILSYEMEFGHDS